ncbi:MAG TPA: hypothetical protein VK864_17885, partial [Longimicrobiales bacterium]|nr:hypothetical protein [Longimicrobiales bacterium]
MSVLARPAGWLLAGCLLFLPLQARGQARNVAEFFRTLSLDSLTGAVSVYYSPGHRARALTVQKQYAGAVTYYRKAFPKNALVDVNIGVALLQPEHWTAFTLRRTYGVPHVDFSGWPHLITVLPAANDSGALADLFRQQKIAPRDAGRAVDAIGFHEFGHLLMRQYFYGNTLATDKLSVEWFEEFMATYLGQGYLWHSQGLKADPIRVTWSGDSAPQYTTLAEFEDHYPQDFLTPESWPNYYGWYQAKFTERAREVFAKQGLDFVKRVRNELPWNRYAEWQTDELLVLLEQIESGFVAWAKSL